MKIQDTILVSDLDGTVIPISGEISQVNQAAIQRFRMLGGTFSVATGRSPIQAQNYVQQLGIAGPVIVNNGAGIYDFTLDKHVWVKNFDSDYRNIVLDMKKKFPAIGIIAISGKDTYSVVTRNHLIDGYARSEQFQNIQEDELPDECCKVLFAVEKEDMFTVSTHLLYNYKDVSFVISGNDCIEMMPKGVSKGYSFEKLIQIYGKELKNSVAVGDYNNDIEMLQKAGLGVAVGNALKTVKEAAQLVVKSCEEDGLADLIEYLINHTDK